jgi:hypothetical protein
VVGVGYWKRRRRRNFPSSSIKVVNETLSPSSVLETRASGPSKN